MIYTCSIDSPLGKINLAQQDDYLIGCLFDDARPGRYLINRTDIVQQKTALLNQTEKWLDDYFAGLNPDPNLIPLKQYGTAFQKEVWEILSTIGYGQTMTYGQIARIMADRRDLEKMSAQAVGQAVGKNPLSIIVPCHRVVGVNGNLCGYNGGLERKIYLLELEKQK